MNAYGLAENAHGVAVRDLETVGMYNQAHAGKAWAILGFTTGNGGVYCAQCWKDEPLADLPNPVFASDDLGEHGMACDHCGNMLDL